MKIVEKRRAEQKKQKIELHFSLHKIDITKQIKSNNQAIKMSKTQEEKKEYQAAYYQANKQRIYEAYYQENKEKLKARRREYYQENKEKINEQKRKKRAEQKKQKIELNYKKRKTGRKSIFFLIERFRNNS